MWEDVKSSQNTSMFVCNHRLMRWKTNTQRSTSWGLLANSEGHEVISLGLAQVCTHTRRWATTVWQSGGLIDSWEKNEDNEGVNRSWQHRGPTSGIIQGTQTKAGERTNIRFRLKILKREGSIGHLITRSAAGKHKQDQRKTLYNSWCSKLTFCGLLGLGGLRFKSG